MTEIPLACTLDAAARRDRVGVIEALVADALIDRRPIDGGVHATFRAGPGVEQRLRDLIAAESRCCAFLTLELTHADGVLALDVFGTPEVIDQLFAAARGKSA